MSDPTATQFSFQPRPKQREVLKYTRGKMGISAVPGSGKTQTLSFLAASLIARGKLEDEQEVLIVTLVNSAVDNFSKRLDGFISEFGLLPHIGYRVRTLHGLAHDIVRERPGLVGLADDFQIVDERVANQILSEAATSWLRSNPYALDDYFNPNLDDGQREWLRREKLPDIVEGLAQNFIRYAKDQQITPARLQERLASAARAAGRSASAALALTQMGLAIYADYEHALAYRGAVDFDDLIRLALQALQTDENLLKRLRSLWPYILEDEAQDSSRLQEEILKLLTGPHGNWVRVGDPNQAIYETFTTASPQFLISFLNQPGVRKRDLPNSGRSTRSILALANHLITWTQTEHPFPAVRRALNLPLIEPTPPGDPQPNPPDDPRQIHLIRKKLTPDEEVQAVVDSLANWLDDHRDQTVAILTPRNRRGFEVAEALKKRKIEYIENLRSTNATRMASGALANLLNYLAEPQSSSKLSTAYQVWRRADRSAEGEAGSRARERLEKVSTLLRKCRRVEDYLYPSAEFDWLAELELSDEEIATELESFRSLARRWQGMALLPVDQLVLSLAQDLFTQPTDLAIAHNLAILLRRASVANPGWRLPEMTQEIAVIARNERRFTGFSEDDTAFNPDHHKGKPLISTIHKAKGLEWDRVYLMSVNTYDFPSFPDDQFIGELRYVRDRLNLEAEAMQQLASLFSPDEYAFYEEGKASHQGRLDYIAERLRLLFVGITRARKELVITWNSGRDGSHQPAIPLVALQSFWEEYCGSRA